MDQMQSLTAPGRKTNATAESKRSGLRRWLRRGPWEMVAVIFIAVGVIMLMQPLSLTLYSYSFVTLLVGTGLFTIVGKFPE